MLEHLRRLIGAGGRGAPPDGPVVLAAEPLKALLAVAAAAAHAETGDLLELVCRQLQAAYGARYSCVHLDNPAVLAPADAARGYATCPVATRDPVDRPRLMAVEAALGRRARAHGHSEVAELLPEAPDLRELAESAGFRGGLAVPLAYQGEALGTIYLYTAAPRPPIDPLLVAAIGAVLYGAIKRQAYVAVLQRVRGLLEHYLPRELVERIVHEPEALAARTTLDEVTVLFSDIRGFTGLAEASEPGLLSELLSEHLAAMAHAVFEHGGMVDKYLGDAVMAVFGAPFPQPDHAARALRAALEMQDRQRELSARWADRLGRPIEIGIGIHSGPVVVGNVGSDERAEYAVVGDTVNVASRLKDLARPGGILVSEAAAEAAGDGFSLTQQAVLNLRGRSASVTAYSLFRGDTLPE